MQEYATQIGLDRQAFDQALTEHRYASSVAADVRLGERLGINATPTLFINGRRITDRTYEGLKAAIQFALPVAQR